MPKSLLIRAGADTLAKLEQAAAAARRFREAMTLTAMEPLGALYLFGYSIECRLKAAYYRIIGLQGNTLLDSLGPGGKSYRKNAEALIISAPPTVPNQTPLGKHVSAGHSLAGWAWLVEQTRTQPGRVALSRQLSGEMNQYARATFNLWSESLRDRSNRPTPAELRTVQSAADWFRRNGRNLWR